MIGLLRRLEGYQPYSLFNTIEYSFTIDPIRSRKSLPARFGKINCHILAEIRHEYTMRHNNDVFSSFHIIFAALQVFNLLPQPLPESFCPCGNGSIGSRVNALFGELMVTQDAEVKSRKSYL